MLTQKICFAINRFHLKIQVPSSPLLHHLSSSNPLEFYGYQGIFHFRPVNIIEVL